MGMVIIYLGDNLFYIILCSDFISYSSTTVPVEQGPSTVIILTRVNNVIYTNSNIISLSFCNLQDLYHIVRARSLALRFTATNSCCVRAIPYENDSKATEKKSFTMCIYVDTGGKGIPEDLKKAANEMFADYEIDYVDLHRRPLCKIVTRLPASKKVKDTEMRDLSKIIEKNVHVFESRLNVTAVQASYKVVDSSEQDMPCVTVFVLGKGRIPVGETDINKLDNNPLNVQFDVVEGYYQPCCGTYKSYSFPLLGGIGIGIDKDQSGVGTLGGFLEDENGKRYILSCEHVLHPVEKVENPSNIIVQPAEIDFEMALETASSLVEDKRLKLKRQENKLKCLTGEEYHEYESRVTRTREELEKLRNDETKVRNSKPRPIGEYCCGLKGNEEVEINDNYRVTIYVDAAIAELYDKEASEITKEKDDEPENDCCPAFGFKNNEKVGFAPNGDIVDLQEFNSQHDLGFMKIGRTTGLTGAGELETTNFFLNRYGYKKNTCAGDLSHVPCRLYCSSCVPPTNENIVDASCIINPQCAKCKIEIESKMTALWAYNCMAIRKPKKPFCDEGDSGALVFDRQGRAWGMVFGMFQAEGINIDICLAAPLGVTLQALETISGKKLTLW